MERHSKRRPAAHDAEPFDDDRFDEASPERNRGKPFAFAQDDSFDAGDYGPNAPAGGDGGGPAYEEQEPPPLHPPEVFLNHAEPDPADSGFYYLSGKPVPPTHPDHGPMQRLPRRPDGGFATYYYCSKEELQEWGIDHPPPLRHRHDGFTPERIAVFIRTLRATGSVTDACRSAGITRKSAYDLYNREDAAYFRQAWDESLRGPNAPAGGDGGGPAYEEQEPPPLHPPEVFLNHAEPDPADSGFYYLSGKPVPPTHPDHGPMQRLPRRPDGGFATYYYCSKEELQEWGIDHPPPLRHRHDGFTPERIAVFIRTLRATGSVTDACRSAGITRKSAYDLYNREDAAYFRQAWDESLRGPNIVLTSTAFDRAINGVEEAVWYKGEFKGWRVRHDNRLLMWLLRMRDPLNFAPLDDLQGWLRHRDVEAHLPTEPMVDRLEAAERAWGNRLPQSEAVSAFPDAEARRHAALEEARDADPPALPDARNPEDSREDEPGDEGPAP